MQKTDIKPFSTEWSIPREERIFMFGFVGTGRCGTKYVAEIMQKAGYDIPHESLGDDGSCGINTLYRAAETVPIFFRWMTHIIRNPLDCIASLTTLKGPTLNHITVHFSHHVRREQSILVRSMMHYLYWNGMCEAVANRTIQIEKFNPHMMWSGSMYSATGIEYYDWKKQHKEWGSVDVCNQRDHPKLTWEDLNEECPYLTRMIQTYVRRHGYHDSL